MKDTKKTILKVLVGSWAHGLQTETSDRDYRGVYVTPTSEILSLGYKSKGSDWIEGDIDNTAYEIGHFLMLATKCNPSILECFVAPIHSDFSYNTSLGYNIELQGLLPYVWEPQQAFNAFVGYSCNQRTKMLKNHLNRWKKYATAYIRTLYNLIDLLETGTFSLKINDEERLDQCKSIRDGVWSVGQIMDLANELEQQAVPLRDSCKQVQDLEKVNDFLLKIRQQFWE